MTFTQPYINLINFVHEIHPEKEGNDLLHLYISLKNTSLAANERGREDAEDVVLVKGTTRDGGGHVAAVVGEALAEGRARNSHSVM